MSARLDISLRRFTGYQLRRAANTALPGVGRVMAQYGLRRGTFSSLAVILDNPGLNQGQLADALAIERPNLVLVVDELEGMGLVRREKSTTDRRAYALHATDKGRTQFNRADAAIQSYDTALTHGLSDRDITNLHRALETIEANATALAQPTNAKHDGEVNP